MQVVVGSGDLELLLGWLDKAIFIGNNANARAESETRNSWDHDAMFRLSESEWRG